MKVAFDHRSFLSPANMARTLLRPQHHGCHHKSGTVKIFTAPAGSVSLEAVMLQAANEGPNSSTRECAHSKVWRGANLTRGD
jgi:hypothetical protein